MIDRSWQGRALGLMQSAGSVGRLVGPLLGGWLLMFDLGKPLSFYARTPLLASAAYFVALRSRSVPPLADDQHTADDSAPRRTV